MNKELTNQNQNLPNIIETELKLAEYISKSELIPPQLKGQNSIYKIYAIISFGKELGLTTWQSIRNIAVVNGIPTMSADLMKAICFKSGDIEFWEESESGNLSDKTYTYKIKAKRKSLNYQATVEFSLKDAEQAKLLDKDNWIKYPKVMCMHRAVAKICRMLFPDLISRIYTPEEISSLDQDEIKEEIKGNNEKIIDLSGMNKIENENNKVNNDMIQFPTELADILVKKGYVVPKFIKKNISIKYVDAIVNMLKEKDIYVKYMNSIAEEKKEITKQYLNELLKFEEETDIELLEKLNKLVDTYTLYHNKELKQENNNENK